jgi:hypothetical protein
VRPEVLWLLRKPLLVVLDLILLLLLKYLATVYQLRTDILPCEAKVLLVGWM